MSLHNTSTHHPETPSPNIPNTHSTEKPNIHTDICTPSEVTLIDAYQTQPSGNTPSETFTRSGRIIKTPKKYNL